MDTDIEEPYEEFSEEEVPKPKAQKRYVSLSSNRTIHFFCSRLHILTIQNSFPSRFHRRKQEPETAEEIDADIELLLGRKGGTPVAARLHFGTANDHDSDMGSDADVTVRPGGDDDSECEVAQGLMEYTDEE